MDQKKSRREIFCSCFLLVFCAFFAFYAIPHEISTTTIWTASDSNVNSRTLPYFAVIVIAIASFCNLISYLVKYFKLRKTEGKQKPEKPNFKMELRAILVFLCCLLYAVLFKYLGYFIATLIAPGLLLVSIKDFKWKHYVAVYVVGLIMYFVFQYLLGINLP